VHCHCNSVAYEPRNGLELDENPARAVDRLAMSSVGGWIDSPEKQVLWSDGVLARIADVFSAGAKSESILLASQWYFDSVTGPDYLLQYVQAMVVLEILLGNKAASKDISRCLLRNLLIFQC
jgi:hypothetical protein